MSKRHPNRQGASIEYGAADCLFPVTELNATVFQQRDAELALDGVDRSAVIVVHPTGLATGYRLARHAHTAITVDSLSGEVRAQIDDALDHSLQTFELVQVGKESSDSSNRSLTEFTSA